MAHAAGGSFRSSLGRRFALVSTSMLAWAWLGCSQTEVVLVIDSDLHVPRETDQVRVVIRGSEVLTDTTVDVNAIPFPLTHLIQYDGTREAFEVEATALRLGAPVLSASASTAFVVGERRLLHLELLHGCLAEGCGDGTFCTRDGCRTNVVAPDALPVFTGVPPSLYVDCEPSDALFCDPFEVDPFVTTAWDRIQADGGTLEITDDPAGERGSVLRVHLDAPGAARPRLAALQRTGFSIPQGETVYARFYVYFPAGSSFGNFNLASFEPDGAGEVTLQLRADDTYGFYVRAADDSAGGAIAVRDEWSCVQLMVRASDVAGAAEFFVDGMGPYGDGPIPTTRNGDTLTRFTVGVAWSNEEQPALDFYLDDLALAVYPLDC